VARVLLAPPRPIPVTPNVCIIFVHIFDVILGTHFTLGFQMYDPLALGLGLGLGLGVPVLLVILGLVLGYRRLRGNIPQPRQKKQAMEPESVVMI